MLPYVIGPIAAIALDWLGFNSLRFLIYGVGLTRRLHNYREFLDSRLILVAAIGVVAAYAYHTSSFWLMMFAAISFLAAHAMIYVRIRKIDSAGEGRT